MVLPKIEVNILIELELAVQVMSKSPPNLILVVNVPEALDPMHWPLPSTKSNDVTPPIVSYKFVLYPSYMLAVEEGSASLAATFETIDLI